MTAPLDIAVAVIEDHLDRILVARRPAGSHLPGLYEFPGGKVHAGEAPEAACARECREELGTEVAVLGLLAPRRTHAYPERTVTLSFFRCRVAGGAPPPRPLAADELRWVQRSALTELPWPAANREIVGMLARGEL